MALVPKQSLATGTLTIRFPKDLLDEIDAYARHLGGATDRTYVIVEAVREVLATDRSFRKALKARGGNPSAAPAQVEAGAPPAAGEAATAATATAVRDTGTEQAGPALRDKGRKVA
jgi:hypothetical protein